jgi:hypothetical protein
MASENRTPDEIEAERQRQANGEKPSKRTQGDGKNAPAETSSETK